MGPTSGNCQPARVLFVRSEAAKARLLPCMSPGNQEKTKTAPVTAIIGYDTHFYEHLPRLFPHNLAMKDNFAGPGKEAAANAAAYTTAEDSSGEYGVAYPVLSQDPSQLVPYGTTTTWTTANTRLKAAETQGAYADPGGSFYNPTTNLTHRPAMPSGTGESAGLSMNGFGAALPSNGSGGERLLPAPIGRAMSALYRSDSLLNYSKAAVATSPTSPVSDAGYTSVSAVVDSYGGSTHHRPSYASSSDVCSAESHESIFSAADRINCSQGSAVDLNNYGYGGDGSGATSDHSGASGTTGGADRMSAGYRVQAHASYERTAAAVTGGTASTVYAAAVAADGGDESGVEQQQHCHRGSVGSRR